MIIERILYPRIILCFSVVHLVQLCKMRVYLKLFLVFSPAYRRTLETGVSVTDDDGPYSLSYPSNCLGIRTFMFDIPNKLFGIPDKVFVIPNIYPGKSG